MPVITTSAQLADLVDFYRSVGGFAWDVETWGEDRGDPVKNDVLWISFATEGRTDTIPMGHPNGDFIRWEKPLLAEGVRRQLKGLELRDPQDYSKDEKRWVPIFEPPPAQLRPAEVWRALEPILFGPAVKIAQNAKFDIKSVAKYYRGRTPAKTHFCTMIASFLLDNRIRHQINLAAIAKRELGVVVEKGIGACVEAHSFDDVAKYSMTDSEVTWEIAKVLAEKLTSTGRLSAIFDLEMDVLAAVCDMELAGVDIDVSKLAVLDERLRVDIEVARGEVYKVAGRAFNLNSNPEKQRLLFTPRAEGGRGLRPNTRKKECLTPKGYEIAKDNGELGIQHYSVSAEALKTYQGKDGLIDGLLHYADLNKLHSTYVVPYYGGDVVKTTNGKAKTETRESLLIKGKAHTTFNQIGAETGRFSSSNPNLQNIPASGEYGRLVRSLFIAPPGYKLIQADYSQIEPRIIASLSGDEVMIRNYREGGDLYTTVGDVMGVDRKAGKTLVLAIAYGVGPDKIALDIRCSVREAKELQKEFAEKFPDVRKHKSSVVRLAASRRPTPYVETILGRRRYLPELRSREEWRVRKGQRQAYNTLIQGTAADLMKIALVRAHSCFVDEPEVNLILTVHDELVAIAPNSLAIDAAEAIRESMEGVRIKGITVPLVAETNIVDNWIECKD